MVFFLDALWGCVRKLDRLTEPFGKLYFLHTNPPQNDHLPNLKNRSYKKNTIFQGPWRSGKTIIVLVLRISCQIGVKERTLMLKRKTNDPILRNLGISGESRNPHFHGDVVVGSLWHATNAPTANRPSISPHPGKTSSLEWSTSPQKECSLLEKCSLLAKSEQIFDLALWTPNWHRSLLCMV